MILKIYILTYVYIYININIYKCINIIIIFFSYKFLKKQKENIKEIYYINIFSKEFRNKQTINKSCIKKLKFCYHKKILYIFKLLKLY